MVFHPDYFEERARMFRAAERGHLLRRCDECGEQQVCADALPIDDEYKECRFAGCQGGTRIPDADGSYYLVLCGMCY